MPNGIAGISIGFPTLTSVVCGKGRLNHSLVIVDKIGRIQNGFFRKSEFNMSRGNDIIPRMSGESEHGDSRNVMVEVMSGDNSGLSPLIRRSSAL